MSTQEVDGNFIQDQSNLLSITLLNLAERCLGSSGAGNISGGIDYELAVPILQTLNIKNAFKVRICILNIFFLKIRAKPNDFHLKGVQEMFAIGLDSKRLW